MEDRIWVNRVKVFEEACRAADKGDYNEAYSKLYDLTYYCFKKVLEEKERKLK